jgi:hypothetical protein
MSDDPLDHMRERIEKCRRLGKSVSDEHARGALLRMAEEIEADVARLSYEREQTRSGS